MRPPTARRRFAHGAATPLRKQSCRGDPSWQAGSASRGRQVQPGRELKATQPTLPRRPTCAWPLGELPEERIGDVAELLGVSERAVRGIRYTGERPTATNVGGRLGFRRSTRDSPTFEPNARRSPSGLRASMHQIPSARRRSTCCWPNSEDFALSSARRRSPRRRASTTASGSASSTTRADKAVVATADLGSVLSRVGGPTRTFRTRSNPRSAAIPLAA